MTNGQWSPRRRPGSTATCHERVTPSGRVRLIAVGVTGQPAARSAAHIDSMSSVRTAQLARRGDGDAAERRAERSGLGEGRVGPEHLEVHPRTETEQRVRGAEPGVGAAERRPLAGAAVELVDPGVEIGHDPHQVVDGRHLGDPTERPSRDHDCEHD